MAYKNIHEDFWIDPDLKTLSTDEKLFFLYCITNPHSHFSGLYYLPKVVIKFEIGCSDKVIEDCIKKLSGGYTPMDTPMDTPIDTPIDTPMDTPIDTPIDRVSSILKNQNSPKKKFFLLYDDVLNIVWIRNMLKYQVCGGRLNDKQRKGIANHLSHLHGSRLIECFLTYYKEYKIPFFAQNRYPYHTVSESASEATTESADTPIENKIVFDYSTGKFLHLNNGNLAYYKTQFPAINVDEEILKAEAWAKANPKNKKSNWDRFIVNWLTRAQDKAPVKRGPEYL